MTRYFTSSHGIKVTMDYFKNTGQVWISHFPAETTEKKLAEIAEEICREYSWKAHGHHLAPEYSLRQTQHSKIYVFYVLAKEN